MIILFGPAGSGKSVQGELLAKANGWKWISVGQLLRDSKDQKLINIMAKGNLVPAKDVNRILLSELASIHDIDHVIFDGFPRQIGEAKWLFKKSKSFGRCISAAIILEVPEEELIKRLSLRGRADDTPEAIADRLAIYHKKLKPIINFLSGKKLNILNINGVGTVNQVNKRIQEALGKCLVKN
jgi:adenylate kinase